MVTATAPKLSIITINYNNAGGLQKTIESVLDQTFKEIEYIVIDGGSTDESVAIIKKFASKINYWVSEKDNGIYNAQNKGAKVAKGEYLLFLNSGDYLFHKAVIASVIPYLSGTDIVYGDIQNDTKEKLLFPDHLTFDYFRNNYLPHQASFIRAEVLQENDYYNETTKFSADWEFFVLAICKHSATYKHLNFIISIFDTTGISSSAGNFKFIKKEREQIIKENFRMFEDDYQKLDTFKIMEYSRLFKLLRKFGFFRFIKFPE